MCGPPVGLILNLPALDLIFILANEQPRVCRDAFQIESLVLVGLQPLWKHPMIPATYDWNNAYAVTCYCIDKVVKRPMKLKFSEKVIQFCFNDRGRSKL